MKVEVISDVAKLDGEYLKPGSIVDLKNDLAQRWISFGFARSISLSELNKDTGTKKETDKDKGWPRHQGAGWYLLPNGEKVQGKDKAEKALKELIENEKPGKKGNKLNNSEEEDNDTPPEDEPEEEDNETTPEEDPEEAGDVDDAKTNNETDE